MKALVVPAKNASKKAHRIFFAKDAIRRVKMNQLIVGCGYLKVKNGYHIEENGTKTAIYTKKGLQAFLKREDSKCEACALGGLMAGYIAKEDSTTLSDMKSRTSVENRLGKYFDKKQLALIELAFEAGDMDRGAIPHYDHSPQEAEEYDFDRYEVNIDKFPRKLLSKDEMDAAIGFGNKHIDDTERFLAIMNNIIRNDGTFTLPKR